jgi:hypothetical protein
VKLRQVIEMTTSTSVGTNLIPIRWLRKFLKVSDKDKKRHWFTQQNLIKNTKKRDNEINKPIKLKEMTVAFSGPPAIIGSVIRSPAELAMGKIKKRKGKNARTKKENTTLLSR